MMAARAYELEDVLYEEAEYVRSRRGPLPDNKPDESPLFGVALSGGGVRAGTVSLGFLQVLKARGLLPIADYLSSVSGGGYASGYLLAASLAFQGQSLDIFGTEARKQLRAAGEYLAMGGGGLTVLRVLRLLGGVVSTTIVNLSWMLCLLLDLGIPVVLVAKCPAAAYAALKHVLCYALITPGLRLAVLGPLSFFAKRLAKTSAGRYLRGFASWTSKTINTLEGITLLVVLLALLLLGVAPLVYSFFEILWDMVRGLLAGTSLEPLFNFEKEKSLAAAAAWLAALLFGLGVGFLASSDVVGVSVLFRDLVDTAYLRPKRRAGWVPSDLLPNARDLPLKDAIVPGVPYPLFGGGSYLRGETQVAARLRTREGGPPDLVVGTKVMDYFLLSPLFCGSETSAYAKTKELPYASTTLADAVATSAASISPLWDGKQNMLVSSLLFLLNMNLGVWVPNPRLIPSSSLLRFLFRLWPVTYVRLIFGKLTTERSLLHVADGGFVDNLGLIELLRRRCRVILAVDNTFDPHYEFKHLRNVVARASIELGVRLDFAAPVDQVLRPSGVDGYAAADHVLCRITYDDGTVGYLVYSKACLKRPLAVDERDPTSATAAAYPTYHQQFPQESTADQFFDPDQWGAYNGLGRQLAESALEAAVGLIGSAPALPSAAPAAREELLQRLARAWKGARLDNVRAARRARAMRRQVALEPPPVRPRSLRPRRVR